MRTYTVQSGDTLLRIAQRYGLTLTALRKANPQIINMNLMHTGDIINIPDDDEDASVSEGALPTVAHTPETADFSYLTAEQLCRIIEDLPSAKAEALVPALNIAMQEAEINTPARQAAFLAQTAHETDGFKCFRELGPDAFFGRYDDRNELGNTNPGDGARYRGRGFIHIAGRKNYQKAGKALGVDLVSEPQLAERPDIAARVAAWFWQNRNLNAYADQGDLVTITRCINGGLNGQSERQDYYERAKNVLDNQSAKTTISTLKEGAKNALRKVPSWKAW